MLKAIHAQEDLETAQGKGQAVVLKLRASKLSKAAELVGRSLHETLSCYQFPSQHWRRLRTNNPLERIIREIRRRTRVGGAFPNDDSAVMLYAARLRYVAGSGWGTRRYLKMELLRDQPFLEDATA